MAIRKTRIELDEPRRLRFRRGAGNRDSALTIAALVDERGGSLKEIALVHTALGDVDTAFEYLERALARDPGELANLDIDPSADPLRADPRYRDILGQAGVE